MSGWQARRVHRYDVGDYGYEIADADGTVIETGAVAPSGALFAAYKARPDGLIPSDPRPGSHFTTSDEVLAWLGETGPA